MAKTLVRRALLGLIIFGGTTVASYAQGVCGQRDAILDRLASHYGETRRGMGLGANNGIVEVFASDETGTWTITVTMPDGRMCLVASGESYEDSMDPLKTSGTPL